ncbi:unnamed protein product [Gordionus sp. m RMFG-2023]
MSSEVEKAKIAASQPKNKNEASLFTKIINREIPSDIIHEDDKCIAIMDKFPAAPVHFLVIPKKELSGINDMTEEDEPLVGHLINVGKNLAKNKNIFKDGYRIVINQGKNGCQSVMHLHIHVIGGKQLGWPPG